MPKPLEAQQPIKQSRTRDREKTREELQFAMLRVKNKGMKLSIVAVAKEAGYSPSLIHNVYPDLAESIRAQVGRATRQQRDDKVSELAKARETIRELREQLSAANRDIKKFASVNETLREDLAKLKASASGKLTILPTSKND